MYSSLLFKHLLGQVKCASLIQMFKKIPKNFKRWQISGFVVGVLVVCFFLVVSGSVLPELEPSTQLVFEDSYQEIAPKVLGALDAEQQNQINQDLIRVTRIIDGDTIELESGQKLRYIGIDTPESVDPNTPDECLGDEASQRNAELVLNKMVRLEKDVNDTDRFGRLLRYVYLDDQMINLQLVQEGYAQASSYPPDVKYQELFEQAQAAAVEQALGLWGDACQVVATQQPTATTVPAPPVSNFSCDCSKSCSTISSCQEAYYQLNTCGCSRRDDDNDGVPCENICR